MSIEQYSVPAEAMKIFQQGIGNNHLHNNIHNELQSVAHLVRYEGNNFPMVPINWRFWESISALKGLEASMINILNKKKYNVEPQYVLINTDHANLFYMSVMMWTIDTSRCQLSAMATFDPVKRQEVYKLFSDQAFHNNENPVYHTACTNIYKTKDDRFFHCHASLNSEPVQKMLGLPSSVSTTDRLACNKIYADAVIKFTSDEIQHQISNIYGQAGTICWSIEEYKKSYYGKANAHVGL